MAAPMTVLPITRKSVPSPADTTAPASLAITTPAAQSHGFQTPATPAREEREGEGAVKMATARREGRGCYVCEVFVSPDEGCGG